MHKILILSSQPYDLSKQSRMLYSYFGSFEMENLYQIYTDPSMPKDLLCKELVQITDKRLIKHKIFRNQKICNFITKGQHGYSGSSVDTKQVSFNIKSIIKKTFWFKIFRRKIWNKEVWFTKELQEWIEKVQPTHIFLSLHPDLFLNDIAITLCKKYNLKLLISIVDDFIFCQNPSPKRFFEKKYYHDFNTQFNELLSLQPTCFYISDKICQKYNSEFGLTGIPIYLSSDSIKRENIPVKENIFVYGGNLSFGRLDSLLELAKAMKIVNNKWELHLYVSNLNRNQLRKIRKYTNIYYHGFIPHNALIEKLNEGCCLVFAEDLTGKYTKNVEYSLSTKVSEYLSLEKPILAIGNMNSGSINFFEKNSCAEVANHKNEIYEILMKISKNGFDTKKMENCKKIFIKIFNPKNNQNIFLNEIDK